MKLLRPLFSLRSPAGANGRLSILIFHRVLPAPDPLFPGEADAARFDRICGWLAALFNVLPLDRAVEHLRAGSLPARAAAITFDDGYADNRTVALPILQRHGLTATFFIATGFLDGGRMFNDSVIEALRRTSLPQIDLRDLGLGLDAALALDSDMARRTAIDSVLRAVKYLPQTRRQAVVDELAQRCAVALPDELMMSSAQVRELRAAGMGIGAHTRTHPILAKLSTEDARAEIAGGRRDLEQLLGERIGLFAYPNGRPGEDYHAGTAALVRELAFDAAVTTAWGAADSSCDRHQLPRFSPWDRSALRFGWRLLGNLSRSPTAAPPACCTS
ncbi:MAG TPA: polysaccharide deacetylase family protein [Rubrivivax sp.]|nr:polysaccharide deacetylase family protein [Rubrivivax sp.]